MPRRRIDLVTKLLQRIHEKVLDHRLVIDDEYAAASLRFRHDRACVIAALDFTAVLCVKHRKLEHEGRPLALAAVGAKAAAALLDDPV